MLHGGLSGARPLAFPSRESGRTEVHAGAGMKPGAKLGHPCRWARVKGGIWRGRLVLSVARPVPPPTGSHGRRQTGCRQRRRG